MVVIKAFLAASGFCNLTVAQWLIKPLSTVIYDLGKTTLGKEYTEKVIFCRIKKLKAMKKVKKRLTLKVKLPVIRQAQIPTQKAILSQIVTLPLQVMFQKELHTQTVIQLAEVIFPQHRMMMPVVMVTLKNDRSGS